MDGLKSIVKYQTEEYGHINVKLDRVLEQYGITRNRLSTLAGVKYDTVTHYYKNDNIQMVDLDFFAKVCYVLGCKLEDLLEYEQP